MLALQCLSVTERWLHDAVKSSESFISDGLLRVHDVWLRLICLRLIEVPGPFRLHSPTSTKVLNRWSSTDSHCMFSGESVALHHGVWLHHSARAVKNDGACHGPAAKVARQPARQPVTPLRRTSASGVQSRYEWGGPLSATQWPVQFSARSWCVPMRATRWCR